MFPKPITGNKIIRSKYLLLPGRTHHAVYSVFFFFFPRELKHTAALRFDKFGSYIKTLERSSGSVRRRWYGWRGRWRDNPLCNLYPFWNAFYYHYITASSRNGYYIFPFLKLFHQNVIFLFPVCTYCYFFIFFISKLIICKIKNNSSTMRTVRYPSNRKWKPKKKK